MILELGEAALLSIAYLDLESGLLPQSLWQRSPAAQPAPPPNPEAPEFDEAPPAPQPAAGGLISDPQRKRMYAIARNAGMNDAQFKSELERMGYASSREVTRESYDDICSYFGSWKA